MAGQGLLGDAVEGEKDWGGRAGENLSLHTRARDSKPCAQPMRGPGAKVSKGR